MLSLVGYCVVAFVLGVGSGAFLCKLFKKCDSKCEIGPLIDVDAYWDPAAACGQVAPTKKRKSKGKRKGK